MAKFLAGASFDVKRPSSVPLVSLAVFSCAFIVYFSVWRLVGCGPEEAPEPFRLPRVPGRKPPGVPSPGVERFECNRESPLTDYCVLRGDVRVEFRTGGVFLIARHPDTPRGILTVRPYARKWDAPVMASVTEQKLRAVDARAEREAPQCTSYQDSQGCSSRPGDTAGRFSTTSTKCCCRSFRQRRYTGESNVTAEQVRIASLRRSCEDFYRHGAGASSCFG
jgi:hypothetical protein